MSIRSGSRYRRCGITSITFWCRRFELHLSDERILAVAQGSRAPGVAPAPVVHSDRRAELQALAARIRDIRHGSVPPDGRRIHQHVPPFPRHPDLRRLDKSENGNARERSLPLPYDPALCRVTAQLALPLPGPVHGRVRGRINGRVHERIRISASGGKSGARGSPKTQYPKPKRQNTSGRKLRVREEGDTRWEKCRKWTGRTC